MGFPGYFLIVMDFIQWSKGNGVPVGPGRGSGAGYSFIALILTQKESDNTEDILSNFIENFPIMLSDHVENKQPVNRVHHGTAGNN